MRSGQFAKLLLLLAEHDVEVIVVGMLAGVLQGVPLATGDCLGAIDDGKTYDDLAAIPVLEATLDELRRRS